MWPWRVKMPTQNLLRLLLLPMLMMRIVIATVCCRFGSWGLIIKLNFCSDFEHKVLSRYEVESCPTLCSKSEQKFSFMTKPQLPNLQQTVANTILIINISNSNKPQQVLSWHLHTPGSHQSSLLNGSEWVSELVSHWQASPMTGLGLDKNWRCARKLKKFGR